MEKQVDLEGVDNRIVENMNSKIWMHKVMVEISCGMMEKTDEILNI